jgi:hypothetical protein
MRLPWKKREEEERKKRLDAERRAQQVDQDWVQIRRHKHTIDKEVERNDWTSTAITLFSGRNP